MELVKYNIYKIKKIQRIFNDGHNINGTWKRKQTTSWIDGVYAGMTGDYHDFCIKPDKYISIHKDDIEEKVKPYFI